MIRVNKFRAYDTEKNIIYPVTALYDDGTCRVQDDARNLQLHYSKCNIMQFINRFDINGKEVFECDIFKQEVLMVPDGGNRYNNGTYWITCVCVVVFDADESKFCGKYEFTRLNKKSSDIDYSKFTNRRGFVALDSKIEVIGNIYENEDLLK